MSAHKYNPRQLIRGGLADLGDHCEGKWGQFLKQVEITAQELALVESAPEQKERERAELNAGYTIGMLLGYFEDRKLPDVVRNLIDARRNQILAEG
jgi:hypothetical protein